MNHHWISDAPRQPLGFLPTPLEPLERLGRELGGPRLWLKRDDCTGLATGGNKTRKLEYLLADTRREGADVVVTLGAIQSNHARQTAAACAAIGLPCRLLLARKVPWPNPAYERSGNLLLDRILGAEVELLEPQAVAERCRSLLETLERDGHLPHLIPAGGSNAIGAMGYARCAMELIDRQGLGVALTDEDVRIDHRYLGPGYGLPDDRVSAAIRLLASREGVLLDPVYSGKAFAGLVDRIRRGEFAGVADVVFVHTGGTTALAVYDDVF